MQAMDVVVAGGHGKIGLRLLGLLVEHGHRARGLIRDPAQLSDLTELGAEPVLCDMEDLDDLSGCCAGADAVVFAAGAGPGSGPERKLTVDLGAAVKLMEAGVPRYVMVSAISAGRPDEWSEAMRPYYEAKAEADRRLIESGLDYTIVRPGRRSPTTPAPASCAVGTELERGAIPRDDVAAVAAGRAGGPEHRRQDVRAGLAATRRSRRPCAACERRARARRCCAACARCPRATSPPTATCRPARRASPARCWPSATTPTCPGTGSCAPTARSPRASASAACSTAEGVPFRGERVDMREAWVPV